MTDEAQLMLAMIDELRGLRTDITRIAMALAGADEKEMPDYPERLLKAPPKEQPDEDPAAKAAADRDAFMAAMGGPAFMA